MTPGHTDLKGGQAWLKAASINPLRWWVPTMYGEAMNTTQRLTKTAKSLGFTVSTERQQLVARDADGAARMSATMAGGKFFGGYVTDRTGHVVSCDTVRDMIRFAS